MEKIKFFILTALPIYMVIVAPCHAQRTSVSEAKIVAQTFLDRDTTQTRNRIARVVTDTDRDGNPLMHEVIMNDSTIVLVSGSKATSPILATYKEATGIFETDNLPCGLSVLVDYYREAIAFVDENNVRGETNDEWQSLLNGERTQSMRTSVGPLLSSRWGQCWSNDSTEQYAYNKYTPDTCTGCQHCRVGCVAVSMGQVMNYYRHPIITYLPNSFSEQFDWCHMPDVLTSQSPLFEHECEAVSRLLSTCGDEVNRIYGCGMSSSDNYTAQLKMIDLWKYSSHSKKMSRYYTFLNLNTFLDTIRISLDLGWPVIMGAIDNSEEGHSFVCDGYNDSQYSFNWGWNGHYNGFYIINIFGNIDVGQHLFTHGFDAVVYLRPDERQTDQPDDICDWEMHLDDFYADFYSNSIVDEYTFPPYYNTPKTTTVLYSADALSSEDWRTIPAHTQNPVEYRAHKEIHLQDGFTAEYDCNFTARIDPCEECEERNNAGEVIGETDVEFGEAMPDMAVGRPSIATEGIRAETVLYPNPTDGELTMNVDGEVQSIVIYNAMGRPVGGWKLHAITPDHVTLDINPLATGTYLLLITTTTGSRTAKFIKQ